MAEAKETLVVLTPGFASNEADTTCLPFLQGHILALRKNYPDTEIIILAFQYPYFKGVYTWHGIKVVSFDGRERPKAHRLLIWARVWKKLKELNKHKNIISVFSLWCTECALIGHHFAMRHKLNHYTWLCGQDAKAGNKYVKLIRPKANELIAMSDFLKREFHENYGVMPAHVIPLGADGAQFSDTHLPRDIDVLGAGSLIPLKQYDVFVRVIRALMHKRPAISAVICGKGPEENAITDLVAGFHLQKNLMLMGEVPHADVLSLMQRAKIFMHTSNYEGLGTVCIEALYAGAHVVSFTKPLDADIPHWHHVSNKDEMARKVNELLDDPALDHDSVCPFTSDDIAISMMQLFRS